MIKLRWCSRSSRRATTSFPAPNTGDGRCDLSRTGRDRRTGRPGPAADAGSSKSAVDALVGRAACGAAGERPDVAMPATTMSWIMIEMCGRQHHLGCPDWCIRSRRGDPAPSSVAPDLFRLIPPATITQMLHGLAMRPTTDLAMPLGPDEADPVADLRPIDRVEIAQIRLDRHGRVRLRLPGPRSAPAADGGRGSRPPRPGAWRPGPR